MTMDGMAKIPSGISDEVHQRAHDFLVRFSSSCVQLLRAFRFGRQWLTNTRSGSGFGVKNPQTSQARTAHS